MRENNAKWLNPPPHKGFRDCSEVKGSNGKGFTLSEVLIALVVIGIVAAITVPTIVAKQREQATVEKVKKFYSTISNAVNRAIVDTGLNVDEWDYGEENTWTRETSVKFMKYIKPYLVILNDDCGKNINGVCYADVWTNLLNGTQWQQYYQNSQLYKAILNDGSVFFLRTNGKDCNSSGETACAMVWYDINGTKGPNVLGKDTFRFLITNNAVIPDTSRDCKYSGSGLGCAWYILQHGNMDYLH